MTRFIEDASGPWLYVLAFVMTFAETGTLLFFIPGELSLFVAGAAAGAGELNLWVMIALANIGALSGDAFGFWLGKRFGPRIRASAFGRKLGESNWHKADDLIRRKKGLIVLLGRWIGLLRAIMPASAGMSGMAYREFLPWDLAGCMTWATTCVVVGYKLGENWKKVENALGKGGIAAALVLVVVVLVFKARAKKAKERASA